MQRAEMDLMREDIGLVTGNRLNRKYSPNEVPTSFDVGRYVSEALAGMEPAGVYRNVVPGRVIGNASARWKDEGDRTNIYIPDAQTLRNRYGMLSDYSIQLLQTAEYTHELPEAMTDSGANYRVHVKYEAKRMEELEKIARTDPWAEDVLAAALFIHKKRIDNNANAGFTNDVAREYRYLNTLIERYEDRIAELFSPIKPRGDSRN